MYEQKQDKKPYRTNWTPQKKGNIVYSYYVLDLLHIGHLLFMKNAWKLAGVGGKAIVGILTDNAVLEKKDRPVVSFDDRIAIAQELRYSDVVIPQETYSPIDNIKRVKPDILVESASHSDDDVAEVRKIMASWGGKVIVFPYYPNKSSTKIKNNIKGLEHD